MTWAASNPLLAPVAASCAVVVGDVIYVTGGFASIGAAPSTKVFVGLVGASGGVKWSETTALPGPSAGHGCAAF